MGLGSTTWWQAVPVVAVAAVLLVGPGALAARVAGYRWQDAVGFGPVLTTSALACTGVVAGATGVRWSVLPLLGGLVLLLLGAGLVRLVGRRSEPRATGSPWSLLVGITLAAAAICSLLVAVTGRPSAFPQNPDTIFHLGSIRWMLEHHDISSLHAGGFISPTGAGFYPAAFHGFAVSLAMVTGCTPVVAASGTAMVFAGIAWPLGVVVLARRVLGVGWAPTVCAGLACAAFSPFPYWLMGYGVLWPNVAGQALLPAALALVVDVVDGPGRLRALLLLVAAVPAVALAHPNAVVALGLLGVAVALGGVLRAAWRDRRRRRRAAGWLLLAGAVVCVLGTGWAVATRLSPAMRASNPPGPEMGVEEGLVDVLFFAPRVLPPSWVLGALVLVGAVALCVRRRGWWVVVAHVGVAVGYLLLATVDDERTRLLTWPWYNNSPRLAALLVLTGALLLTATAATAAELVARSRPRLPAAVPALGAGLVLVAVTGGLAWGARSQTLSPYFDRPEATTFASDTEIDALRALGRQVPADAVVAANPWTGAAYLYLASGQRMLFPTEKAWTRGDRDLIGRHLDEAATDPRVCTAVRRQHVRYAITGGTPATPSRGQARRYAGIDDVSSAAGFTRVAQAGPYRLWRVDACG